MCFKVFGFGVDIEGNIGWVVVILLALGGVGMSIGLVISGAATIGKFYTIPLIVSLI